MYKSQYQCLRDMLADCLEAAGDGEGARVI